MASPQIRPYQQQYGASEMSNVARADPGSWAIGVGGIAEGLKSVAGAMGDVQNAAFKIEAANANAWTAKQMSDARLQWTQHFVDRQAKYDPSSSSGFTPDLLKDFDEYAAATVEAAPSPTAKRFLASQLATFRTGLGESSIAFEAKARIDYRMDQYNQGIQNTEKLMNTDPAQYRMALAEQVAVIDGSELPPVQKSALRQKAIDGISTAAVWSQIQRSPGAFLDSIGFGSATAGTKTRKSSGDVMGVTGNLAFDALPFDKRVRMFEGAVTMKAQLDADAERIAKDASKKIAEDALKEGWGRLASGKLTRSYIEEIRPVLDASQYHALLTGLKSEAAGGQKTDAATYRELQRLIYSDPAEAEKFAFRAHKSGLLSNEHLASGLSRSREIDRSEGPKSEYERTRRYIVGSLDPGPMVQDPIGRARLADATDVFDRWVTAEKRTDAEIEKRGREIVDQYKFVDMSDTIVALPLPRSGKIRRAPNDRPGMVADIVAAGNKAEADYRAGRMSEADYRSEMSILNRWRKAVQGN